MPCFQRFWNTPCFPCASGFFYAALSCFAEMLEPGRFPQDKILQSMGRGHEVVVTNDGATILKSLYVDNPAAKVLVGAVHDM